MITCTLAEDNKVLIREAGEPLYELHLKIDSINQFLSGNPSFYYAYPDSTIDLASKVVTFSDSIMYVRGTAMAAANLGKLYYLKGDYSRSLEHFFTSFEKYDLMGEEEDLGKTLAWISWLNLMVDRLDKAEDYQRVATALLTGTDTTQPSHLAIDRFLRGSILKEKGDNLTADSLITLSLKGFPQTSYLRDEALVQKQNLLMLQGKNEKAKDMASSGAAWFTKGSTKLTINYASLLNDEGNSIEASRVLKNALSEAERSNLSVEVKTILKLLSETLSKAGFDDEAYTYMDRYYSMDQKVKKRNDMTLFQELDNTYGNIALEKQVQLLKRKQIILEQEAEINELKLKNSRLMSVFLSVIVALCIFILYQSFRRYKLKSRINKELHAQNKKIREQKDKIQQQRDEIAIQKDVIEQQNEELLATNHFLEEKVLERTNKLRKAYKDLKDFNTELDTFIYKAYHDIRGPLISMKGLCQISLSHVKDETALEYLTQMNVVTHRMNDLMNSMLRITEVKDKAICKENIETEKIINEIIGPYTQNGHSINFSYDIQTERLITDKELLQTILENIVKNAVQYSYVPGEQPSKISISAERQNGHFIVNIIDDGIGIPEEVASRIFDMFYRGTTNSEGFGLGLYTARVAARRLKGELKYKKTRQGHTQFSVSLPAN
ncbi:ATP-binding protein [Roseivirga sp. BDSF3-8]|uniref:ATP-binding protein n=1 Tax=Roseivirga sp. BDSF3-8 TaxID=3241598 RepID=UPI00353202A8